MGGFGKEGGATKGDGGDGGEESCQTQEKPSAGCHLRPLLRRHLGTASEPLRHESLGRLTTLPCGLSSWRQQIGWLVRRFSRRQLVPDPSFIPSQAAQAWVIDRGVGFTCCGGVLQDEWAPIFGFGRLMMMVQSSSCGADATVPVVMSADDLLV